MGYVVGVDGGGTKTTAAVIAEDLSITSRASAGPANYRSVGLERASEGIATAVSGAIRAAGVTTGDIEAICMCLAGFDTDLDLPVPQRAIAMIGYRGATIVENDVVGAWAGATEANPGIVVIAGTGATALGMNSRGDLWRTDGWDYILGDAGSGYAIGEAGIRAAMKALDGRAGPTLLARFLGRAYGVQTAEEMRRLVDSTKFGKFEIAGFSVHVAEAADAGDATALAILRGAGSQLAENAIAIIHKLQMSEDTFPLSTVGSVLANGNVIAPFQQAIAPHAPHASFVPARHPPEVGAAIMARRRLQSGDVGSWTLGTGQRRIRRTATIDEVSPA